MKKLIILLVPMFALISCKKTKTEPEPIFYQFAADGLSYIQLPVKNYYIYKDSASAAEDSVVVVTSTLNKIYVPAVGGIFNGHLAYNYQVYSLKLKAQNTLSTQYWFSGFASSDNFGIIDLYNDNGLLYSVFTYPINGRFISSMVVEGNVYANVEKYEFDLRSPIPANNISGVYYWAKGVGIIKRQITTAGTTKTESLLRHG